MIHRFSNYFESFNKKMILKYYAFDFDDNILYMPTKIHMEEKSNDGTWLPKSVSTSEFAEVRNDKEKWRIPSDAFSEFRDFGPRGEEAFLLDTISAISNEKFGPAWSDFVECLTNGSLFAIITARGHESNAIRLGIEWIIDNVLTKDEIYLMYNNLVKFSYLFSPDKNIEFDRILRGIPSQNSLIKTYLDNCDFIGVSSPSRGGTPDNPEMAKEEALIKFNKKINGFAKKIGLKAKIGFSDDDLKNVKHIEDLVDGFSHERFSNISEFIVKGTKNPKSITRKVRKMIETSNQAPGLESSVLKFTQFGNMTSHLYPEDIDIRQDDIASSFRKATKYLAKTSKNILGKRKRKKSSK